MTHHRGRLLLLLLTLWLPTTPVCADYYRYTDEKGGVGFVDDIKKIPASCRAGATLIREAKPPRLPEEAPNPYLARPTQQEGAPFVVPAPEPTSAPAVTPSKPLPPMDTTAKKPWNWGWLALFLAAAGASLVLIFQLLKSLQSRQLARVILFVTTMVILVFGYKLYVDQMVSNYFAVKSKVLQLMGKAMQRMDTAGAEER